MTELKNCPFCGGSKTFHDSGPRFVNELIGCEGCGVIGNMTPEQWNTRANEMTWRTIDSAPRDGTRVLLYFPREEYKIVTAVFDYNWELSPDGGTEFSYEFYTNPTHWMPLPPAPDSEGK